MLLDHLGKDAAFSVKILLFFLSMFCVGQGSLGFGVEKVNTTLVNVYLLGYQNRKLEKARFVMDF